MAAFIKSVYKSGIIGDFFKGSLSSKPDNAVDRIVCIRRYEDGRCTKYEQPLWVNEVVINKDCNENNFLMFNNPFNALFSSSSILKKANPTTTVTTSSESAVSPMSYFETNYEQMIKGLLGDADSGTVYITYWYGSLRHVVYYDIPKELVRFPLYKSESLPAAKEEGDEQMTFTDDDTFVASLHLVFRNDESLEKNEEDEEDETMDVTNLVRPFLGPKNDFHGMTVVRLDAKGFETMTLGRLFDFMKVVDYAMFVDKQPIAASSVHRLHHISFMRITYGDMNVVDVRIYLCFWGLSFVSVAIRR